MIPTTTMDIYNMRQRRITTRSHYKMKCECCGKTIHRGDEITQVLGCHGRMRARVVEFTTASADVDNGCFTPYAYAPTRNRWVHINCRPQCFKDWYGGEYYQIPTAYSNDIERRLSAAAMDPDWGEDIWAIPRPKWTWQTERLAAAIIPLQRKVKKKWRKIYRERWTKKVVDAFSVLNAAKKEVKCEWQEKQLQHLRRFTIFGGVKLNAGEQRCGYKIWKPNMTQNPHETSEYRKRWCKRVIDAARVLEHSWYQRKYMWQEKLLEIISQSAR